MMWLNLNLLPLCWQWLMRWRCRNRIVVEMEVVEMWHVALMKRLRFLHVAKQCEKHQQQLKQNQFDYK